MKKTRAQTSAPKKFLRNRVRIIGGAWRSRIIEFPDAPGLRPTADRVRETLFNWIGPSVEGKRCLDLFAGSGALGFEASSRKADHVVLIDSQRPVYAALQANAARLDARDVTLVYADARQYLRSCKEVFDVVFLDPPFGANTLKEILNLLPAVLAEGAVVYLESEDDLEDITSSWRLIKSGKAGMVKFGLVTATDLGGN